MISTTWGLVKPWALKPTSDLSARICLFAGSPAQWDKCWGHTSVLL